MKVCIVGLGAIGGFVAHRLIEGGLEVSALARGATLAAVRERGLVLHEASDPDRGRAVPLPASDDAASLGPQDLVVLAVKTTALPSIPASIAPLLGPETAVLSAMNGVPWWFFQGLDTRWRGTRLAATDPGGVLHAAIDGSRVVGCVVHMAASCPAPGVVRQAFGDRFIVGEPGGGDSSRLAAIADVLRIGGLQVEASSQIERDVWLKLWGNMTMNPVSALTGATMDRILDDPLLRRFVSDAMVEAAVIGERLGLPISMTPEERHVITRKLGAVRTSMLQDVEAARPIELDALIGSVAEMGRLVGADTPNIDALLGLTRLFGRVRGLVPG
jgi:2-dehydropantoate 2-reductase